MKKFLAILLTMMLVLTFASCSDEEVTATPSDLETPIVDEPIVAPDETVVEEPAVDTTNVKSEGVMTYAEYAAAELDAPVVIEAYVQAHQSWWDNKITVYAQDPDGAYFLYEMACSEEDAAKLEKGTKIRVTGYKSAWAGEVEIVDATFEILEGNWVAEAQDLTALLGTEELIDKQNVLAVFKGLTVEAIEFKNGEPGDDIYVTLSLNGSQYNFCVEYYLTNDQTDVYKAVQALQVGDNVDVEGFVYWYEGVNTHITGVTVNNVIAE